MSSTEQRAGITLVGIALPHKTTNNNQQATKDIGALWETFWKENIVSKIPDRSGETIYGVYYNYEGDYTKPYEFFIGVPVKDESIVPFGMIKVEIPSGTYKRFTAKGKMPDCIISTWSEIWNSDITRSYTADYELYDSRAQDMDNAEVDIFIAVEN